MIVRMTRVISLIHRISMMILIPRNFFRGGWGGLVLRMGMGMDEGREGVRRREMREKKRKKRKRKRKRLGRVVLRKRGRSESLIARLLNFDPMI